VGVGRCFSSNPACCVCTCVVKQQLEPLRVTVDLLWLFVPELDLTGQGMAGHLQKSILVVGKAAAGHD